MTARYGNVTHIVRVLDQHDPLICLHVVGHWVSPVRVFLVPAPASMDLTNW